MVSIRNPDPTHILHLQVWAQILHLIENHTVVAVRDCVLNCTICNNYVLYKPCSYLISTALISTRKPDPTHILHLQVWAQILHLIENHTVVVGCGAGLQIDLHIMQQLCVVQTLLLSHIHRIGRHKKTWPNPYFASSSLSSDFASDWKSHSGCGAGLRIDLHIMQQLCVIKTLLLSHIHRIGKHKKPWPNPYFASSSLSSDFASDWKTHSGCGAGLRIDLHIMQQLCVVQTLLLSHIHRIGKHKKPPNPYFASSSLSSDFASDWKSHRGSCGAGLRIDLHIMQQLCVVQTLLISHFHRNGKHKKSWPNPYIASSSLSSDFASYSKSCSGWFCCGTLQLPMCVMKR